MHERYNYKRVTGDRYLDLLGMITNPIGTLLGPTGLGLGGGGSAVAPGGVLAPGSEMGMIASAKMAQDSARELNSFNAEQAEKSRNFSSEQAEISREYNTTEANVARQFNSAEAQKNREFQAAQVLDAQKYNTAMSNSAYQRAVTDMKKAGINPMLAFMQGGASSPISATASGSTATGGQATSTPASSATASGQQSAIAEMFQKGLNNTITSSMDAKRLNKDLQLKDSEIEINKANKLFIENNSAKVTDERRRIQADTMQKIRDIKYGKVGGLLPQGLSEAYDNLWIDFPGWNKKY